MNKNCHVKHGNLLTGAANSCKLSLIKCSKDSDFLMLIKCIAVAYETDQHRTVLELYIKPKLS